MTAKWREALVDHAFTPHLQFQYAAGKNTADIVMAIDVINGGGAIWIPAFGIS